MTPGTLTEIVLDEAEAIVRAEWMRLQHDVPCGSARRMACSEMPAARTRPGTTATAIPRRPSPSLPRRESRQAPRRGAQRRVWPTQRSPPHSGR
jgi:hypothetical protein